MGATIKALFWPRCHPSPFPSPWGHVGILCLNQGCTELPPSSSGISAENSDFGPHLHNCTVTCSPLPNCMTCARHCCLQGAKPRWSYTHPWVPALQCAHFRGARSTQRLSNPLYSNDKSPPSTQPEVDVNACFVLHHYHHLEQLKNTQNSHTEQKNPRPQLGSCLPKISFVRFYQQEQGVEAVGTSSWETKSKACEQIKESISPFDAEEIPLIIKKGLISRSRSVWSHQN